METQLSSHSLSPLLNSKPFSSKSHLLPSLQTRSDSLSFTHKSITSSLKRHTSQSLSVPNRWVSHAKQGLAALTLSLALNFSPQLYIGNAQASEFDLLNERPPK
ncbi:hypothetical protein OIU77_003940 [Salix suchowensis]|uniref:Uncharacterized protein n=1 Tax=Salix suchowensis TaxID=1278906 RepID=A0ABQ9ASR4_9ROSI|nr:hypothetical protein OIU77_003940 [Salix suchowensis]